MAILDKLDPVDSLENYDCFLINKIFSFAIHNIQESVKTEISILSTYDKPINDPQYSELLKKAIDEKLKTLISNKN